MEPELEIVVAKTVSWETQMTLCQTQAVAGKFFLQMPSELAAAALELEVPQPRIVAVSAHLAEANPPVRTRAQSTDFHHRA